MLGTPLHRRRVESMRDLNAALLQNDDPQQTNVSLNARNSKERQAQISALIKLAAAHAEDAFRGDVDDLFKRPLFQKLGARLSPLWNLNPLALLLMSFFERPAWCYSCGVAATSEAACGSLIVVPRSNVPVLAPQTSLGIEGICLFVVGLELCVQCLSKGWRRFFGIVDYGQRASSHHLFLRPWRRRLLLLVLLISTASVIAAASDCAQSRASSRWRLAPLLRFSLVLLRSEQLSSLAWGTIAIVPSVMSVMFILLLLLVIFSLLAMVLLGGTAVPTDGGATGGVGGASFATWMLQLTILLTTANFPDVMMPAYNENRAWVLFFMIFLVLGFFVLLNVVLARVYSEYKASLMLEYTRFRARRHIALSHAFALLKQAYRLQNNVARQTDGDDDAVPSSLVVRLLRELNHYSPRFDVLKMRIPSICVGHEGVIIAILKLRANQKRRTENLDGTLPSQSSSSSSSSATSVAWNEFKLLCDVLELRFETEEDDDEEEGQGDPEAAALNNNDQARQHRSGSATNPLFWHNVDGQARRLQERHGQRPLGPFAVVRQFAFVRDDDNSDDDETMRNGRASQRRLSKSWPSTVLWLSFFFSVLNIVNVIAILWGLETRRFSNRNNQLTTLEAAELVFSTLFVLEVGIKFALQRGCKGGVHLFKAVQSILTLAAECWVFQHGSFLDATILRFAMIGKVLRVVFLTAEIESLATVYHALARLGRPVSRLAVLVFLLLCSFASIGTAAFGGVVSNDNPAFNASSPADSGAAAFAAAGYMANNFNDHFSSLVTLFELLVVNNWFVIMDGITDAFPAHEVASRVGARIYFFSVYVLFVLFMLNVLVAYIIDAFEAEIGDRRERNKAEGSTSTRTDDAPHHVLVRHDRGGQAAAAAAAAAAATGTSTRRVASTRTGFISSGDPVADIDAAVLSAAMSPLMTSPKRKKRPAPLRRSRSKRFTAWKRHGFGQVDFFSRLFKAANIEEEVAKVISHARRDSQLRRSRSDPTLLRRVSGSISINEKGQVS